MQVLKPPGEPNAARLSLVCSDLASLLAGFTHFSQSPPLISGSPALWQGKHSSLFTVRRGSALASLFTDLPALKTMDTLMPNLSLKFFFHSTCNRFTSGPVTGSIIKSAETWLYPLSQVTNFVRFDSFLSSLLHSLGLCTGRTPHLLLCTSSSTSWV